jgi:hypothetical protein
MQKCRKIAILWAFMDAQCAPLQYVPAQKQIVGRGLAPARADFPDFAQSLDENRSALSSK